ATPPGELAQILDAELGDGGERLAGRRVPDDEDAPGGPVSDSIWIGSGGRSSRPVGVPSIVSTTSSPAVTRPKTVCLPSSQGHASAVTTKNCEPLVFGPALAIASAPRVI